MKWRERKVIKSRRGRGGGEGGEKALRWRERKVIKPRRKRRGSAGGGGRGEKAVR